MVGDKLSFLSIETKEENSLYPTLLNGVFRHYRGRGLEYFSWGQVPRPPVSFHSACMFYCYFVSSKHNVGQSCPA